MPIKAYLVEDQADIRNTLIEGMEEVMPVQFIGQAVNEPEALRWLSDNGRLWDVLIVDLFLRNGSGFGVLQACKARSPNQKAVVLTSYVDSDVVAQCHALGADAVFDKNNQLEQLVKFCLDHAEDIGKATHTDSAFPLRPDAALQAPVALHSAAMPLPTPMPHLLARRKLNALPDARTLVPWRKHPGH